MAITARKPKSEYSAAPEGLWPAVCCDVIDNGMVTSPWGEAHMVTIRWQLEDVDPKSKHPFTVQQRYRLSLHEKAKLRAALETWRGKKFTKEELEGFDLEKLLGANGQVQVIHNIKANGDVFANVQAIVAPNKGAKKMLVRDYIRVVDRKDGDQPGEHDEAPVDDNYTPF